MRGRKKAGVQAIVAILVMALAGVIYSNQSMAASATLITKKNQQKEKSYSISISTALTSSVHIWGDQDYSFGQNFSLYGAWTPYFAKDYKLSASFGFDKEYTNLRPLLVNSDPFIALSYKAIPLAKDLNLSLSLRSYLPLTKKSFKRDSMRLGLMLAPSLSYQAYKKGAWGLALRYGLNLSRNFHEYTVSTTGLSNRRYALSNLLALSTTWKKFSLNLIGTVYSAWTYEGYHSQSFFMSQELAWTANDKLGFSVGHSNGGNVLKADGVSSNVSLAGRDSSRYYAGATYTF